MSLSLNFLIKEKRFDFIHKLRNEFSKAEVYLVGGAVRDLFLSRPTKDYDFVVKNVPAKDLEDFLKKLGIVNLVGQTFGVFKFIPSENKSYSPIDIALPRKDFALGTGGYRDVEIQTEPNLKIEEDLSRRDFTINAIAIKFNDKKLQVIDPFKGFQDLKKKLVRAVGNPDKRIKEDYSRMLRAIRFACQLGFNIEKSTWQAIKNKIAGLNEISRHVELVTEGGIAEQKVLERRVIPYEVIAKEFLKSFKADTVQTFDLYDKSGVFEQLMPEVLKMKGCPQPKNFHSEGDVWTHTRLSLQNLSSKEFKKQFGDGSLSMELILATLFHDIGKPYTIQTPEEHGTDRIRFNEHDVVGSEIARDICQRLKLSSPEELGIDMENVVWLVKQHLILIRGDIYKMKPSTIEKYFFNPDKPGQDLLKLSFADVSATVPPSGKPDFTQFNQMLDRMKQLKELSKDKKELPETLINGYEIIKEFNLKPGPKVGKLLKLVREEQLSGRIKQKTEAIKFLKKSLTQ